MLPVLIGINPQQVLPFENGIVYYVKICYKKEQKFLEFFFMYCGNGKSASLVRLIFRRDHFSKRKVILLLLVCFEKYRSFHMLYRKEGVREVREKRGGGN
jgi:hypothetical protein